MVDKKFLNKTLDIALAETGEAAELAYAIYGLLEGNDPEYAAQLLEEYGYTDENSEWKYDED
jgi:ABC-type transport system substrate-binding protein